MFIPKIYSILEVSFKKHFGVKIIRQNKIGCNQVLAGKFKQSYVNNTDKIHQIGKQPSNFDKVSLVFLTHDHDKAVAAVTTCYYISINYELFKKTNIIA